MEFFLVYIREAHPVDGSQAESGARDRFLIEDPKTQEERERVARDFARQFKMSLPILVDTIDNKVERAYNAMPDRIYVIDARGKIAYKGGHGPDGFRVSEVPPVLDKLLGVQLAARAGIDLLNRCSQGAEESLIHKSLALAITRIEVS